MTRVTTRATRATTHDDVDADRHVARARGAGAHRLDGDAGANGGARETTPGTVGGRRGTATSDIAELQARRSSRDDAVETSALVSRDGAGLGRATAMRLVREGYALVVPYRLGGFGTIAVAPPRSRARRARGRIVAWNWSDRCVLERQKDIDAFSLRALRRRGMDVRVIVHCAAAFSTARESIDGGEVNFHHCARLTEALVLEMMVDLKEEAHARVVFVGSFVHQCETARRLGVDAFEEVGVDETPTAVEWTIQSGDRLYVEQGGDQRLRGGKTQGMVENHRCERVQAVLVDPDLVDTRLTREWPTPYRKRS